MNRHVMVVLMLSCLALMLFNIGGSADDKGTGNPGSSGGDLPDFVSTSAAPLPEFSLFSVIFAIVLAIVAYYFVRKKQTVNFSSN